MRGPDHGATDPAKAFADWDEAVSHLLYLGEVTLTSEQLSAILMFASLHGSTNDLYYTAYMSLNDSLTNKSSTFNAATVRAAALTAFNAEQRRLKKHPTQPASVPASVLGFAANVNPRRSVPSTGTYAAVLDSANALITASISMARFVSFVPPQTPVLLLVSVLLPRLQHRPSLVTLSGSITLLSTTLPLLLKTSRSSVASLRPSAKPISIAPTPSPTLLARVPPTTIFPTRTDSHV